MRIVMCLLLLIVVGESVFAATNIQGLVDGVIEDALFGGPPPQRPTNPACHSTNSRNPKWDVGPAADLFHATLSTQFGQSLNQAEVVDCEVLVSWFIGTAIDANGRNVAGMEGVFRTLKALSESHLPFNRVVITGIRAGKDQPVHVEYTRKSVNRINWQGFGREAVFDIADVARVDTAFR